MLFIVATEKTCKALPNVTELGSTDYLLVVIGRILMRILVPATEFVSAAHSCYSNWNEFSVDYLTSRSRGVIIGVRLTSQKTILFSASLIWTIRPNEKVSRIFASSIHKGVYRRNLFHPRAA